MKKLKVSVLFPSSINQWQMGYQPMLEPAKASAEEILDDRIQGIEAVWTNDTLRKWLHEQHEEMKRDKQAIRASIGESLEIIEKEFKQFGKLTMDWTYIERSELYDNLANVTISCRFSDLPEGGRLYIFGNGWTYGDWDKEEDVDEDDLINAKKYALIEFIENMYEYKDDMFDLCEEISDERSG
jgi:hypothetical protein